LNILHTSDWHLGQHFFTKSRKAEHQAFIQTLLELVVSAKIDAIIIAGDVFDTGAPPSYAREMYNQFVVDLHQLGCALVVLGGNHDSVSVLNESRQLLSCLNAHVIASTEGELAEQVVVLNNREGAPGAVVCAIPYVRPRDVLKSVAGETGVQKRQALEQAISQHYHQLYDLAKQRRSEVPQAFGISAFGINESGKDEYDLNEKHIPIIATGHLSAMGVSQSDSVRDIYIGSLDGFDAAGFPPADYIALGHIHKAQKVAKSDFIRYCGSPIPLSFDEVKTPKQVLLLTFEPTSDTPTTPKITTIELPTFQPMQTIKGSLQEIEQALDIADQQHAKTDCAEPLWLSVEVQNQDYLSDLQQRIQAMCEGKNVEVLQLRRVRNTQRKLLNQQQRETLAELSPEQVFAQRLSMETEEKEETETDDKANNSEQKTQRNQRLTLAFKQVLSELQDEQKTQGNQP